MLQNTFTSNKLAFIALTLALTLIAFGEIFLHPRVLVRANGVTIKSSEASFYIPSIMPMKIYAFNPKPPSILEIIEKNTAGQDAVFGVFVKNMTTGQEITLNAEESFTAASLYKLAVMYTIFKLGNEGKLDITQPDIADNLKAMITVSSNEASIHLVDKYTSWRETTDIMRSIGLKDTSLNQLPPVTTPKDVAYLLEMIAEGKAINKQSSTSMLELLLGQKRRDRIPVLLPKDAKVGHKTGELNDVRHDAAIIFSPDNDYILVIMSKGSKNPESVKPIMSKVSLEIYEFFERQWNNPPEIL